jgi:hypothetical protein
MVQKPKLFRELLELERSLSMVQRLNIMSTELQNHRRAGKYYHFRVFNATELIMITPKQLIAITRKIVRLPSPGSNLDFKLH